MMLGTQFLHNSSRILLFILIHLGRNGLADQIKNGGDGNDSEFNPKESLHSEKGETVQVKFLTSLRHKREIGSKDFHILEITRTSFMSTMQIHLVKNDDLLSEDFKFVVGHGEEREEIVELSSGSGNGTSSLGDEGHCLYGGHLSGDVPGRATLTACGDHPGFTGVIMTDHGDFVLEPHHTSQQGDSLEIPHTLSRLKGDNLDDLLHKCRGAIIPEGMSLDPIDPTISRHAGSTSKKKRKRRYSSKPVHDTSVSRPVIELAVFGDECFFESLTTMLKTTSMKTVKGFIVTIVHMMQILYDSSSLTTRIKILLVHIEIFKKNSASLDMTHGYIDTCIKNVCRYTGSLNKGGDTWDHAMMFTCNDLHDEESNAAVGIAYLEGMCTTTHSCSVIEGNSFRTAYVSAHELGHSCGMEHDGESRNPTCAPDTCLMASVLKSGQREWSSCSCENIDTWIGGGGRLPHKIRENCLMAKTKKKGYKFGKKLPGQIFTGDIQCFAQNGNSFPKPLFDGSRFRLSNYDFCQGMYCTTSSAMSAIYTHIPLDGTTCGSGKICLCGKCQKKS